MKCQDNKCLFDDTGGYFQTIRGKDEEKQMRRPLGSGRGVSWRRVVGWATPKVYELQASCLSHVVPPPGYCAVAPYSGQQAR